MRENYEHEQQTKGLVKTFCNEKALQW